jgi:hypothetical protein
MATKEEARKASRTAYKRNLHASDIPAGYTLDTQHSDKPAKVFIHQGNQNVIVAHRRTKGLATAVIGGRRKHSKRFQYAQAVTDHVRATHPHANITAVGHFSRSNTGTGYKGNQQVHHVQQGHECYTGAENPPTQTDNRKTGDVISVLSHFQRKKMKRSGKWKEPFRAHNL